MKSIKIILGLLLVSLLINVGSIYMLKTQSVNDIIKDNSNQNYLEYLYDLNNYVSTSYETKKLKDRLDRLYKQYLKDKNLPREYYYVNGRVENYWSKKCISNLRRIAVISAKVELIEEIINNLIKNDLKAKQEFDMIVERREYHEKLIDMSNFYARFVSDETYTSIQNSLD